MKNINNFKTTQLLLKPYLWFMAIVIFFTTTSSSCFKDNAPTPDLSKGYPEKFTNKVSNKNMEIINKIGQKVYEGQDPPRLSINCKMELYVVKSYDPKRVGEKINGDAYYKFYNYNPIDKTCFIDWKLIVNGKVKQSGIGGGDFVLSGHENKFTSVGFAVGTLSNGSTVSYMSVYSGEVTADGISNFESGIFYLDKDGNVDPNTFEIFVGISTLANWPETTNKHIFDNSQDSISDLILKVTKPEYSNL